MKLFAFLISALLASACVAAAQTIDPTVEAAIQAAVPSKYATYVPIGILSLMFLGRGLYALATGRGLIGWIRAILYGDNASGADKSRLDTSKLPLLVAGLCLLGLTSCAGVTAWMASPLGQATVATATALGKQVAKTAEGAVLVQIILKAEGQRAALVAQGENAEVAKEVLRQSEIAGLAGVVEAAQTKYQMLTGARYVMPKQPAGEVNP